MKSHRALPFLTLAAMMCLVGAAGIQGCGQGSSGADMKPADFSTVRDLQGASPDLTSSPDLAASSKLMAACMTLCQCLVASGSAPDAQTCSAGCTSMSSASYYPGSLFGGNMPAAACLDCISGAACNDLFSGMCAAQCP